MIRYGHKNPLLYSGVFYILKNFMKIFSKKDKKYFLIFILLSLVHNFIVFPAQAALENKDLINNNVSQKLIIKKPDSLINHLEQIKSNSLVEADLTIVKNFKLINQPNNPPADLKITKTNLKKQAINNKRVVLTAYNSEAAQTDGDPCSTANGFNVCQHGIEDTVAANFLPMGTKIMIPELFGDRIFVVRDRMNKRFSNRVDVWMIKKSDALRFGVKQAEIVVLES